MGCGQLLKYLCYACMENNKDWKYVLVVFIMCWYVIMTKAIIVTVKNDMMQ